MGKSFRYLPECLKIPPGLGHLLVVNSKQAAVHPHPGEGLARYRLGLCDFIFVVGKIKSAEPP